MDEYIVKIIIEYSIKSLGFISDEFRQCAAQPIGECLLKLPAKDIAYHINGFTDYRVQPLDFMRKFNIFVNNANNMRYKAIVKYNNIIITDSLMNFGWTVEQLITLLNLLNTIIDKSSNWTTDWTVTNEALDILSFVNKTNLHIAQTRSTHNERNK